MHSRISPRMPIRKNQCREEWEKSIAIYTHLYACIYRMITYNYTGAIIVRHVKNGEPACRRCVTRRHACLVRRNRSWLDVLFPFSFFFFHFTFISRATLNWHSSPCYNLFRRSVFSLDVKRRSAEEALTISHIHFSLCIFT